MTVHELKISPEYFGPNFDLLDSTFGYNKAACLNMGCEPLWVLEQATDADLEANISAVDAADVF